MIIHKEFGEERNSVVEFSSQNRAIIHKRVFCVTVVKVISEKSL